MTNEKFSDIEQAWYDKQHNVLGVKADEYATEDRLHNFKAISALTRGKVTPLQVAMILRGKQVISLYDKVFGDEPISEAFFDEKAGDDANYIVLAKALHVEEEQEPKASNIVMPMHYNEDKDTYDYWSEKYQCWIRDIEGFIGEYYKLKDKEATSQPRNLSTILAEELVKNGKFYAKMGTDADKEAFIAERAKQVMNDMFPSTKSKSTGSEHGGIVDFTPTKEIS